MNNAAEVAETQWALVVARSAREASYLMSKFVRKVEVLCTTWDDKDVLVINVSADDLHDLQGRGARLSSTRDEARRLGLALHG